MWVTKTKYGENGILEPNKGRWHQNGANKDFISYLVKVSCELGSKITRYDFLEATILSNVCTSLPTLLPNCTFYVNWGQ